MRRLILLMLVMLIPVFGFGQCVGGAGAANNWTMLGHITNAHSAGLMAVTTVGTVTITTGGTFEKLIGGAVDYTGDHLEDFNETTNGRLTYTGTISRDFNVEVFTTIESGEVTQSVCIRVAKNGTTIENSDMQADFSAVNSHTPIATGYIVDLATNDYLEIYTTSDQDGDEIIVHRAVIKVTEY